jgi:hypothetical protein
VRIFNIVPPSQVFGVYGAKAATAVVWQGQWERLLLFSIINGMVALPQATWDVATFWVI